LANVGIKQNGSIIGTTDRNGSFVIPNVTPYLSQDIEVNAQDLPFNTELDSYEKRVVAPLNGGTVVTFNPVTFIPAFVKVTYNAGEIPPVGYEAKLYNDDNQLIETDYIIDGGSIQLSKFSENVTYHLEFTVKDGTFSCPISKKNIQPQASNQYLFNLGEVKCLQK
jgi:outer membrane usher protein FimD/PapC